MKLPFQRFSHDLAICYRFDGERAKEMARFSGLCPAREFVDAQRAKGIDGTNGLPCQFGIYDISRSRWIEGYAL